MLHRGEHGPAFADGALAELELRLDERDQPPCRRHRREHGREHLLQRDERHVYGRDLRRLAEEARVEDPGVDLLHDDDARVLPQLGVELTRPDIYREYL